MELKVLILLFLNLHYCCAGNQGQHVQWQLPPHWQRGENFLAPTIRPRDWRAVPCDYYQELPEERPDLPALFMWLADQTTEGAEEEFEEEEERALDFLFPKPVNFNDLKTLVQKEHDNHLLHYVEIMEQLLELEELKAEGVISLKQYEIALKRADEDYNFLQKHEQALKNEVIKTLQNSICQ